MTFSNPGISPKWKLVYEDPRNLIRVYDIGMNIDFSPGYEGKRYLLYSYLKEYPDANDLLTFKELEALKSGTLKEFRALQKLRT